jgi:hypothetical protein
MPPPKGRSYLVTTIETLVTAAIFSGCLLTAFLFVVLE